MGFGYCIGQLCRTDNFLKAEALILTIFFGFLIIREIYKDYGRTF